MLPKQENSELTFCNYHSNWCNTIWSFLNSKRKPNSSPTQKEFAFLYAVYKLLNNIIAGSYQHFQWSIFKQWSVSWTQLVRAKYSSYHMMESSSAPLVFDQLNDSFGVTSRGYWISQRAESFSRTCMGWFVNVYKWLPQDIKFKLCRQCEKSAVKWECHWLFVHVASLSNVPNCSMTHSEKRCGAEGIEYQ